MEDERKSVVTPEEPESNLPEVAPVTRATENPHPEVLLESATQGLEDAEQRERDIVEAQTSGTKVDTAQKASLKNVSQADKGRLAESSFQNFLSKRLPSVRADWVVDMEREKEGYTAGRWKTYLGVCSGALATLSLATLFLLTFCRVEIIGLENAIGYGDKVFSALIQTGEADSEVNGAEVSRSTLIGGFTFLGWMFVYIADVSLWSDGGKCLGIAGSMIIVTCVILSFVTALLVAGNFSSSPYFAYMLLSMFILTGLKVKLFPDVQKLYYLNTLTVTVLLSGISVFTMFCVGVFRDEQYYDGEVQVRYHKLLGCEQLEEPFLDDLSANSTLLNEFFADGGELDECDEAFLVWSGPAMFFTASVMFSGVLFFLTRAEAVRIASQKPVGLEPAAQVFVSFVLLSMLGLWVAASIASATSALGDTILSLSFYSVVLMVASAVAIFGPKYLSSEVKKTSIGKKVVDLFNSDWGKGLIMVTSLPVIGLFLMVDYLKHLIRRKTFLGKNIKDPEELNGMFTPKVAKAVEDSRHWKFGSVITKALVWGMIFFVMSVGVSRMTLVFLSWLREELFEFTLLKCTFILIGVGLFMFLLPPVPGVPVYITTGVILPSLAEQEGVMSLTGGIFYAICISVLLKLMALVVQQKVIGERFGSRSVRVRYAVGVNSVELRAMKKLLSEPGWSFKKVAVLCGGPDWPTSVLTGIMRLNVFQMILGTTPIFFLIAPCVVTGAMVVKAGEEDNTIFVSLNTISVFLTVIVQSGAMLAAAQVLATAAVKYEDELKKEKPDEEVLRLEEQDRDRANNYKIVTAWENLTSLWKGLHIVSLFLMILSCYAFMLLASDLFVTFDITDDIGDDLDGNVLNIVKDAGWVFISLFSFSTLYYFVFKHVHQRKQATEAQIEAFNESKIKTELFI